MNIDSSLQWISVNNWIIDIYNVYLCIHNVSCHKNFKKVLIQRGFQGSIKACLCDWLKETYKSYTKISYFDKFVGERKVIKCIWLFKQNVVFVFIFLYLCIIYQNHSCIQISHPSILNFHLLSIQVTITCGNNWHLHFHKWPLLPTLLLFNWVNRPYLDH